MIERKEIISGTEEELLEYFKKKYNLVKYEYIGDCEQEQPEQETPVDAPVKEETPVQQPPNDPTARKSYPQGSLFANKVSNGFSGLFDGTSWGNK